MGFKCWFWLHGFVLGAGSVCRIAVQQLEWSGANGRMVRRVVGKVHGRQEFFPVERVIIDVGRQILFDALVEIFDLSVALWMCRCCFCSFDVPQSPKFVGQLVAEFFSAIGMDLFRCGKTVDPVV